MDYLKQLISYAKELEVKLVTVTKSKVPILKEEISGLYRQAARHCENRGLHDQGRSYLIKSDVYNDESDDESETRFINE